MKRLLIGIAVLLLGGFLIRMLATLSTVTAANDSVTLSMLRPPNGFIDAAGDRGCPLLYSCFRTPGQLQPMTAQNARVLISQFGIGVSRIDCPRTTGGIACTGSGTVTGVNRTTEVFFFVVSGADSNRNGSGSATISSGTYAGFGTKALRRLRLAIRLA